MAQPLMLPSFAAGELSPAVWGRTDFAKYHVGAAKLRNFNVDYRGGAFNRAGTMMVGRVWDKSTANRLIPFVFSTTQAYALLFGNLTMRVIANGSMVLEADFSINSITNANPGVFTLAVAPGWFVGDEVSIRGVAGTNGVNSTNGKTFFVASIAGTVVTLKDQYGNVVDTTTAGTYTGAGFMSRILTVSSPYFAADLALLKYTQSADTITLTHPSYVPYNLTRTSSTTWVFTSFPLAPKSDPPSIASVTPSAAGTTGYVYRVTSIADNGTESMPSPPVATLLSATMSTTGTAYVTVTITPTTAFSLNSGNAKTSFNVYRTAEVAGTVPVSGAAFGFVGTIAQGAQVFVDRSIAPNFAQQPPQPSNIFNFNKIVSITPTAGTGYVVGDQLEIWPLAGSAYGTPTYAYVAAIGGGGSISSLIVGAQGYTSVASWQVRPGYPYHGTGAAVTPFALGAPSYPSCCAYYQQRLVFGGFSSAPTQIAMSKTGSFYDFSYSSPSQANDSLTFTIVSTQVNAIKSLVPFTSLLVLNSNGAWRVDSGQLYGAITPTSILAAPQAYNGASDVIPIVANYDVLYVQARGSIVRDLSYNFYANVFTGTDVSMLAKHLFENHSIIDWAWAEEPSRIVWAVRDDGILLSLTYVKEQEVIAWSPHDTQGGAFLSVCTVPEGTENAVYFVVGRFINGLYQQFVERLASRYMGSDSAVGYAADPTRAFFVDCGLQYSPVLPNPGNNLWPQGTSGLVTVYQSLGSYTGLPGYILRGNGGYGVVQTLFYSPLPSGMSVGYTVQMTTPFASTEMISGGDWSFAIPTSTISGIDHLNGATVAILADGLELPQQVVVNGSITLTNPASVVTVGLPIQAQFQSMYLDHPGANPTIQGKRSNVTAVTVRMRDSCAMKVGTTFSNLTQFKERGPGSPLGTPLPLVTGDERILVPAGYSTMKQICIQQDSPLPCNILAVIPEMTVGDN